MFSRNFTYTNNSFSKPCVERFCYGFNGKEKDDEVKGNGNSINYGFRDYDPRIGRFFRVDPIAQYYSELTPYQYASNSPIENIDIDGLEKFTIHLKQLDNVGGTKINTQKADFVTYKITFSIEYPDGTSVPVGENVHLIVFFNKFWQTGKYSANALPDRTIIPAKWKSFSLYKENQALNFRRLKNKQYMHPAPGSSRLPGKGAILKGCGGVTYEEDAVIGEDEKNVFSKAEFSLRLEDNKVKGFPRENVSESNKMSYKAMGEIFNLYQSVLPMLQRINNVQFKTGSEVKSPQYIDSPIPKQNIPGNTPPPSEGGGTA